MHIHGVGCRRLIGCKYITTYYKKFSLRKEVIGGVIRPIGFELLSSVLKIPTNFTNEVG